MLSRTIKMAFWVVYDHLGKLLLVNVLCTLALMVPGVFAYAAALTGDPGVMLMVAAPLVAVMAGVMAPVECAALAYMIKELIDTRDGSVGAFFTGLKRYFWRASGIGLLYLAAGACLGVSVWFYPSRLGDTLPWLGYTLSAVALWCLIFTGLTALLIFPALVQKNGGAGSTVKLSALLVLDNPFFMLGLALNTVLWAVFSLVPPVFMFLSVAPLMTLVSSGYEMLSRKYAALDARRAAGEDTKEWVMDYNDANDDYLNRGFRDFLFPWKG